MPDFIEHLPPEIAESLVERGVLPRGKPVVSSRLTGGVSSDIWKVEAGGKTICVKRAMEKLAVKDEWIVPVERNRYERLWYETVSERVPGAAPAILAYDNKALFFAMAWLDPDHYWLWKPDLMAGRVDLEVAAAVGKSLAAIHSSTANDSELAETFSTDALFHDLRLDPYLGEIARRHLDLAGALTQLIERTAETRLALVHGDVSPKNIMIGGDRHPVFLDAECAWYGDPAFDLAFCLNHLLLKCMASPENAAGFLDAFQRFSDTYRAGVTWEPIDALEERAASLLPGLLLARVDGKSPVEYITEEIEKERVRNVAIPLIQSPPKQLAAVSSAWGKEMEL